jgi:hypothetical protein
MNTRRFVVLVVVVMAVSILPVLAAEPPKPGAQPVTQSPVVASQALRTLVPCSVVGQVKLDPADKTNGFLHYKGDITFKAAVNLEGVNLSLNGPKYACTCVTCPSGSSHATGLKPDGKFSAGQSKTYKADCGSFPATNTLTGPLGKGKIEHFVATSAEGGVFKWADCSGTFTFTQ